MMSRMPRRPSGRTKSARFDVPGFLDANGVVSRNVRYLRGAVVFSQGSQATHVFYIREGGVKPSVLSSEGKEAVVAILEPGDFFGEGCLAGQSVRMGTASAVLPTAVLRI